MKALNYIFIVLLMGFSALQADAMQPDKPAGSPATQNQDLRPRAGDCTPAKNQIDQNINNVRARLTTGGDVWWDLKGGKYVVPNIDPASGLPEVSSIFAASVWIGGYDIGGNLKLAGNTFRSATSVDWWSGPLDPFNGTTSKDTCAKWDKFFTVLGLDIKAHIDNFKKAQNDGVAYDAKDIPKGVLGWPGKLNPYFRSIHGFDLPKTDQGMAGFWDYDDSGDYDPTQGDYPIIEIRGCAEPQYGDEMIFWIYNDAGGIHSSSKGAPIQMEVQVQSFAYATNDELNNMTFQRYKLINRATDEINKMYFAIWVDPDLGCHTDDYIGCDTSRSLMYVYNDDVQDGTTGCTCTGGAPTYCNDVPILGVDYFRGPLNEDGEEIGMSSFTYFNNPSVNSPPAATGDPEIAIEFYRYMSGFWKDGTPFTLGGSAYGGTAPTKYAFTGEPNDATSWSMCSVAGFKNGDRRTVQASGPFKLLPGAVNELIVGVPWVADQQYPCPDLSELQAADDLAQSLFDACFDIFDGPDAPDLDIIEMDRALIFVLSNDTVTSNNKFLQYTEKVPGQPAGFEDTLYRFEGYKIFQLAGPTVGTTEYNNPDKARLVAQVDVQNGVSKIYNWVGIKDPNPQEADLIFVPELQVTGGNTGVKSSFRITEDLFSQDQDRKLINHKKYYYVVIAYAYNNYFNFDKEQPLSSQKTPYREGRFNIPKNSAYVGIPRKTIDTDLNAEFGDGAIVTRLDGQGSGGANLDLEAGVREQIILGNIKDTLTYKAGRGPVRVNIFNPIDVTDGEFELTFTDHDMTDGVLDSNARWNLVNVSVPSEKILSDVSIEGLNEQIIGKYGFSIIVGQIAEPGTKATKSNGFVGKSVAYADNDQRWFKTFNDVDPAAPVDQFPIGGWFNFVKNGAGEPDLDLDPDGGLTQSVKGGDQTVLLKVDQTNIWSYATDGSSFVPFLLADYRFTPAAFYVTPAMLDGTNNMQSFVRNFASLKSLNNVDIVMTPNKDLWSRCVVLETASKFFGTGKGGANMLEMRKDPSVTKEDANNDGLADVDPSGEKGMGWFPGYAIDIETGKRLNILFGENSYFKADQDQFIDSINGQPGRATGDDMMYNPTDQVFLNDANSTPYLGGMHFIYVTNTEYDACAAIRTDLLIANPIFRSKAYRPFQWAAMSIVTPGMQMKSYNEGLIPTQTVVRMRVDNAYAATGKTGLNNGHPKYRLKIQGRQASALDAKGIDAQLDNINITPNPYYAYSQYEASSFSNIVKITNLPAKCVVTIYTLDGKFIRQYKRNETRLASDSADPGVPSRLITPDLEWDIKNSRGIPVASGVYIIHVEAEGLGERVLKWFSVNRAFDTSGL